MILTRLTPPRSRRLSSLAVLLGAAALVVPGASWAADRTASPHGVSGLGPGSGSGTSSEAVVAVPVPLPLPGQLKPLAGHALRHAARGSRAAAPRDHASASRERSVGARERVFGARERVGAANEAARMQPDRAGFVNAIQQYPWVEGALYQVYAAPGQVTDIVLQEGEQLVGPGPVAAGDTVRWMIGDTASGAGAAARVHILVKPTRGDIATNLVINTNRRTYHLELRATPKTYMASVSWTYPADQLIALRMAREAAQRSEPVAGGIALEALNFGYRMSGDSPDWRPSRVFDDGRQVFIEFPQDIARGDMPPLFVLGAGGRAELVNYRVSGRFMTVDRLFAAAELRLGDGKSAQRVRIERQRGKARS